ncbi:hypothetical protein [Frischella perrara]|jgi:hypothetical protein|uniref:Uncharacterized protein n=1 Tax=Frischella perrara TaxID=1267021 RepID=A0A0A7S131_FRIPE|nr:hypothetical protein [Frischella perrara]AJA44552.1 hypothetical protein FPB0191_00723 [Frischella perrara]MCT6874902.1 hypothetical protein [Frischella perrara]PWV65126.1 hypothetical protein C7375_102205 [Frischella perrara]PXY95968.1 hypothetical protein DKK76_03505 [Frischella perrara]
MKENFTKEKLESVLRKINWAQQILDSARDSSDDLQMIDILSGVSFIMDSASDDAENLYRSLR